jgi:hypothetical protein
LESRSTDADRSIEVRRRLGFVTEDKELYPYMTVEQIIRFIENGSWPGSGRRLFEHVHGRHRSPHYRKYKPTSEAPGSKRARHFQPSHTGPDRQQMESADRQGKCEQGYRRRIERTGRHLRVDKGWLETKFKLLLMLVCMGSYLIVFYLMRTTA